MYLRLKQLLINDVTFLCQAKQQNLDRQLNQVWIISKVKKDPIEDDESYRLQRRDLD